jgi:RNA polymerase sigma-70 factor (ECF subfamily)
MISDAQLVAGSRADFGVLFDRHAESLFRYCARRIGPDEAQDVVAETFLVAYQRRRRYDKTRANAAPWLFGIATNLLRRRREAEARAHRQFANTTLRTELDGLADDAAARIDAELQVRALAATLADMSDRLRDVLFLYAAGLEYQEIAESLGVPVGTVRSRLNRARSQLRSALAAHESRESTPQR